MEDNIRAFIAIHLPQEVKAYLGRLSADLARQVPQRSVRWVKPERMHLTLRFLGDMDQKLLPDLGRALDEITANRRPFNLHLEGFGCFPNCKRPRILWAGTGGDIEIAASLKKDIDESLIPFDWEPETRPFRPHLTIGRIKDSRKVVEQRWPHEVEPVPIHVVEVHLIESELTPAGPIYTVRHSSSLKQ
jgi:2'-5' RNA ligase